MADPAVRFEDPSAVPADTLFELAAGLRRTLLQRGEHLGPEWPEQAARDLHDGRLVGVVARRGDDAAGLALLSVRAERGFGQLHLTSAEGGAAIAAELFVRLIDRAGPSVPRSDLGVSGLGEAEEAALARVLGSRKDTEVIRRFGLIRPLDLDHPPRAVPLPAGYRFLPVRTYAPELLARLDWTAFRGSPDAAFLDETPGAALRLLQGILTGQLGRFLEEASFAVADETGALCGMLLTAEETPRIGIFVDLAVDPGQRRRGLGRALLARGLRALLALGQSAARLWVTESNAPARALYDGLGFRVEAVSYIYRYRAPSAEAPTGPSPQRAR